MQHIHTEVIKIDPVHPEEAKIERAAALIRAGEVVVFPTETVYGLGADALQPRAVERIFAAKGRPLSDPLIVHIADEDALRELELAIQASATPDRGLPTPLDIQAGFVHYARISKRLRRDITIQYRELFVRNAEKLKIPRDVWQAEAFLSSMVLRSEEWLVSQSRLAVADSKDPGA